MRGVREFFDLFRIDHVLGFYRIYGFPWRPEENNDYLPLSLEEAKAKLDQPGVRFVDIRDVRELEREGQIPGAVHAPRGMLDVPSRMWCSVRAGILPVWLSGSSR